MNNLLDNNDIEPLEETQPKKFGFREKDLLKQIRNHQLFRPLHELEATKNSYQRDGINILEHMDTLYLSNYLFDVISDEMIFGEGVDRTSLIKNISQHVLMMNSHLTAEISHEITEIVLDHISNKKDNFKTFKMSYYDPIENKMLIREFNLIAYKECDDNIWRYYLTKEGFTTYLSMLEMDSDMEIALNDFRIQKLLERERFSEAVSIAKINRKRTVEHKQKLHNLMRSIERNVRQVSWQKNVKSELNNSHNHIDERISEELKMLKLVQEHLDEGVLSSENREQLLSLQETINSCKKANHELAQHLLPFHNKYLEFHSKTLNISKVQSLPDFEQNVLYEYLKLTTLQLKDLSKKLSLVSSVPFQPKIFDPFLLVEQIDSISIKEEEIFKEDLAPIYEDIFELEPTFSDKLKNEMRDYFNKVVLTKECTNISSLISLAQLDKKDNIEIKYLLLLFLDQFEKSDENQLIKITKSLNKIDNNPYIQGDELIIKEKNDKF